MIEINLRNGNWELIINGSLMEWHEELDVVIQYLSRHVDEIEELALEQNS